MNLILTMAGKYSRFRDEGYKIPKYLLPYGSHSILWKIISFILHGGGDGCDVIPYDNIYLIANQADEPFMGHVRQIMESREIPLKNLILIGDTKGQAETAHQAITRINPMGPILIHNIDTILYERDFIAINDLLTDSLLGADGYIDVFRSNNHSYSYVTEKKGQVTMVAEKVLVSELATSGLYGFASAEIFNEFYTDNIYISEIYQKMIAAGRKVKIGRVFEEKDTIVLGTPQDYLKASASL